MGLILTFSFDIFRMTSLKVLKIYEHIEIHCLRVLVNMDTANNCINFTECKCKPKEKFIKIMKVRF